MSFRSALDSVLVRFGFSSLKEDQIKIIENIVVRKRSTFCVLPTGYGKSVCFYLPPVILNELDSSKRHISVVVSPLRSLVTNQKASLRSKGFVCVSLSELQEEEVAALKLGKVDVLFSSPEALMTDFGRELLTSDIYRENTCLLAFDEAHCITEWGDDFRPSYGDVSLIRSWLSQAPVAVLTATCTKDIKENIEKKLLLNHQELEVVATLPDRPNIFLSIEKGSNLEKDLRWYADILRVNGVAADKAIVYCRSMTEAGAIYGYLMHYLGDKAWVTTTRDPLHRIVDIYHRCTPPVDQERVLTQFPQAESEIRCVIATVAFGMGVDITDIRYVIHWGCSKSILQYWHETGRCSRDGNPGFCKLYLTPRSLNPRMVDIAIRNVCRSTCCLRVSILEHLCIPGMDPSLLDMLKERSSCRKRCRVCSCPLCTCCSRCKEQCDCSHN